MPEAFNRQNRKSHSQPPNVSVFSIALISRFSVSKAKESRISNFKDWNSHLALKSAVMPRRDVNTIILTSALNQDIHGLLLLLIPNRSKKISCSYSVSFTSPGT